MIRIARKEPAPKSPSPLRTSRLPLVRALRVTSLTRKRSAVRARQRPQRKASLLLGFLSFRYSDDNVRDALWTRIGRDLLVEPLRRRLIGPLVQVPIDVEHGADRTVSKAVGDHFRVLPLSDQ